MEFVIFAEPGESGGWLVDKGPNLSHFDRT
jgi:hypothetical protein